MLNEFLVLKLVYQLPIFILMAWIGYSKKWLTLSGCIAAVLMGLCYNYFQDIILPLVLLVGGTLLSKLNNNKQEKNGRNAIQVLANGAVGTCCLVVYYFYKNDVFYIAFLASFSISIADTFSSEIGKYYKDKTIDIITLKPIAIGLSGGISLKGTLGGLLGAIACGIVAFFISNHNFSIAFYVLFIGFLGMVVDSILGSTLQAKYKSTEEYITEYKTPNSTLIKGYAWCTNNMVNLLSNIITIVAYLLIVV